MSFLKNIFVIAKNSYTGFANDIEFKAKAIEVENQEKKAKADVLQEKIKQVELEKRTNALLDKTKESKLEKRAEVVATQEKIRRTEILKKNSDKDYYKKIKNIISSGDLELVKKSLTSKEDALQSLSDDEFIHVVSESTDEKEAKEFAIDLYVKYAKLNNQDEVINYLMTLQ